MTENNEDVTKSEVNSPFSHKEEMIVLLKTLFKQKEYSDSSFDILPGMSTEEQHAAIASTFQRVKNAVKDRPSIVNWLHSKLFEDNDFLVPMALLFIELYEEHSSPDQEKRSKCDFR